MLKSEEPLSHYGINSKNRADIVIHKWENDSLVPLAIIECKAPNIYLGEKENAQAAGYANDLSCDYVFVTNGIDLFSFAYNESLNQYLQLESFPIYSEMLGSLHSYRTIPEIPDRIPFSELQNFIEESHKFEEYIDIGRNTPIKTATMSLNLWESLLDCKSSLELKQYDIFELIEDLGIRLVSYGNASGGVFSGPYRSFLIKFHGEHQIISFAMSTYCTHAKQDIEKTVLNVAIDTDKSAHHALQLVIDDNIICCGNSFDFYHNGRIAVGNIGSGKIKDLHNLVSKLFPRILCENKFYLGTLNNKELFSLNDTGIATLMENLISYALIRDEYRKLVKSSASNQNS